MKNIKKEQLLKLPSYGVWSAALTPLNADLSIDHGQLVAHARFLLDQGCHGIGLFGTTGEANSFSIQERMEALEFILKNGLSTESFMVGTGCCALSDTVQLTQHAIDHGITKILLLPPFYYKNVSDDGLFNAFAEVVDRLTYEKLEIYLYHFPAMSQIPLSINLITKLCAALPDVIAGIKDSSGSLDHSLELASNFPTLSIFPGNETHLLATLGNGCAGVISATANANAKGIRQIFDGWLNENTETPTLQEHALSIRETFGRHALVPALKEYAHWSSKNKSWLRMRPPLAPLSPEESKTLHTELSALSIAPK
ncbi:MAG: dihydrodipicolinate synthase family protein [Acidiferrobacteraceae bacterium]|nr:dihydrodipicolinate synthase family protein [Acidiferrobacteraceae bacterium]|tara:strand:+ start:1804 stop:2739 length:936 start_codon:yes stop_codon:yes gene_type:complete